MANTTEKKFFVLRDRGGDLGKPWYIEFYYQGKRKQVKGQINHGATDAQRRELAKQLIAELSHTYQPPPPNHKIKSTIYDKLDVMAVELSKRTVQDYRSQLNQLFDWLCGRIINPKLLEDYFVHYRRHHAQTTTYQHRRKLMTVFIKAKLDHLLRDIKLRKGKGQPMRYFQRSQEKTLINWMDEHDEELALYCRFVRFMAIRPRAELIFIRSADIFHEERQICLRGRVPGRDQGTKNREHAYINIPRTFYPHLEQFKRTPPNHYIFPSTKHKQLNPLEPASRNRIAKRFPPVLKAHGFSTEEYGVYSWKHTGAVRLYQHSKDIKAVQIHLRHANPVTTEVYLQQLGVSWAKDVIDDFPDIGE